MIIKWFNICTIKCMFTFLGDDLHWLLAGTERREGDNSCQPVVLQSGARPVDPGRQLRFPQVDHLSLPTARSCAAIHLCLGGRHGRGWRTFAYPVEAGCRGYTGSSIQRFLKSLDITGSKALRDLAGELLALAPKPGNPQKIYVRGVQVGLVKFMGWHTNEKPFGN